MELNNKNMKKIVGIIAFGIILFFVLQNFSLVKNTIDKIIDVLSPFLWGAGIAFVLNIPLNMFENKLFKPKKQKNGKVKQSTFKRPISIILSILLMSIVVTLIVKLIIPQIISVIIMFVTDIPQIANDLKNYAIELTKQYPDISNQIMGIEINWETVTADLLNLIKNIASSLVTSSIGFVGKIIGGVFNSIIAIIFAIYILISKEKILIALKRAIMAYFPEEKYNKLFKICALSKDTFHNFITSQCTEAVILGLLCFVGMILFRIPLATTVSVLVGVTALVPIVGAIIGMVVGAILILSISPIHALGFVIFLLILQQIETNVIYPKVVGSSVGLPGILVLLVVAVAGSLWGILGLIIGLPTASVVYTVLQEDIEKKLGEKEK